MELRFSLISDGTQMFIEEPIGFDRFEPVIERNDLHGASVEFSDIELEFDDCDAVELIQTKYEESIDSIIELFVEMKCTETDDFSEMYRGLLDLGTIKFSDKKYKSVSCKVGQSGVLTTFNNRISTDVSIDDTVSVDGVELPAYDLINKEINIPGKHLTTVYKVDNYDNTEDTVLYNNMLLEGSLQFPDTGFVFIPVMFNTVYDEIDGFDFSKIVVYRNSLLGLDDYIYKCAPSEYISDRTYNLKFRINCICKVEGVTSDFTITGGYVCVSPNHHTNGNIYKFDFDQTSVSLEDGTYNVSIDTGEVTLNDILVNQLFVFVRIDITLSHFPSTSISISYNSDQSMFFEMQMQSIMIPTNVKCNMLHETMARITESITNNEMTVWSDYYGRPDSFAGATKPYLPALSFGFGSLRCLTNGYKLRQYKYANGELAKMYLSMKKLVNSLSAIDNIGCGFSFEQGRWWVRVENWKWFYKNIELFEINNPSNVERSHDLDETFTRLKIGYKKYADISEANVVDTFHSERNYTTLAKAVDKELQAMSELVADPFAIEYTRRKSIDKDTKDWNYDEDIFMICVMRVNVKLESGGTVHSDVTSYEVDNGMEETGNTVTSPDTMINVYISPARNAIRWADRFSQYPGANGLSYASGTRNTTAKGTRKTRSSPLVEQLGGMTRTTTYDQAYTSFVQENASINKETPYLKSQKVSFEYPISLQQWNSIRMNPYGYIRVNGERYWIKKVQYNFKTGLTKFELIPEWS